MPTGTGDDVEPKPLRAAAATSGPNVLDEAIKGLALVDANEFVRTGGAASDLLKPDAKLLLLLLNAETGAGDELEGTGCPKVGVPKTREDALRPENADASGGAGGRAVPAGGAAPKGEAAGGFWTKVFDCRAGGVG